MATPPSDGVREGCERIVNLARRGREPEALEECRSLAERFRDRPEPRLQLGVLLLHLRDKAGAETALRECLALAPNLVPALTLLGDLLYEKPDPAGALGCFEALARRQPDDGRAWNNMALAQLALGRWADAEAAARRARTLLPRSAVAWLNLGRALAARGRHEDALAALDESLRHDPRNAAALDLAGRMQALAGRFARSAQTLRRALEEGAGAQTSDRLGEVLMQLGDVAGAIGAFRDAEARDAAHAPEHASRALFALHADDRASPADIGAAHREWAARYASFPAGAGHRNDRDPHRRIRVGYVSPRFQVSSVAFLLLPVLENHDPREVEIFCFAGQHADDGVTSRMRARAAAWRDTRALDDDALAQAIRDDAIDIVVDLAGHTPGNRLRALARRPAPVALTWLDYFDTTGCEAIDAIVTDALHTPPGDPQPFAERRLRLAPLRYCYGPPEAAPEPAPPPSSAGADVVFGAFHRFAKIGPKVIRAWSELLSRMPRARLVIKNGALDDEGERRWHHERLAATGLPMSRVELRGSSSHLDLLAQYAGIDVALDTFPYNGGITTMEALWMGRPVVAIEGDSLIARQSAAILRTAGCAELVARDAQGMVALASSLAGNPARLAALCAGLRGRLAASPVCDAAGFTRTLEAGYRDAWRAWCAGEPVGEAA